MLAFKYGLLDMKSWRVYRRQIFQTLNHRTSNGRLNYPVIALKVTRSVFRQAEAFNSFCWERRDLEVQR